MKSVIFSVAVAGFAAAQDLSLIPGCALNCLVQVLPEVGCDSVTDFACACENIQEITSTALECFTDACDTSEIAAAQEAAQEACAALVTGPSSVNPTPPASTTVIGIIVPDPTTTPSSTATVTTTITTPGTPSGSPTPSTSETETSETGTATETETDTTTGTETETSSPTETDNGVAKPLAGAGLALLAAIAAL